ncbi:MAG: AlkA N-terminal domain-containing protein [Thermodesulfobacteriota bacterium]
MKSKEDIYYEAILTRDYRFDGKFFAGSTSTWIYCRPICPAKPKRENVRFFDTAIEAESAGFRPCLRCHPESAPSSPAWLGKSNIVKRGLNILLGADFYEYDEDSFANVLGISARHVRRLFLDEIGRTPKSIADTNRLDFARKLIVETDLPFSKIAFASGFSSIRRFNDAIKKRFTRAPSALRKSKSRAQNELSAIKLELSYRPPFSWSDHLNFYSKHSISGLEQIEDQSYFRLFSKYGTLGQIKVTHSKEKPVLLVTVTALDYNCLYPLTQNIRQMFDLNTDPLLVSNAFQSDRKLNKLIKRNPGLRLSRFWDAYEGAICTILGQLVSLAQARKLVGRIVEKYGEVVTNPWTGNEIKLFPTPKVLSNAKLDDIGTTKMRASAINQLSTKVVNGDIRLDPSLENKDLREALVSIKGIGPWTADYIALRALGEPDIFPKEDLVLRRSLNTHPYINLVNAAPYRSYLAAHLWSDKTKKHYLEVNQ